MESDVSADMRVVRILVYEGETKDIETHFQQTFVKDDGKCYGSPHNVIVKEVFRGWKQEPLIEYDALDDIENIP